MCFSHDSHPPIAPIAGAAIEHEHVELTATDGNRFAAFRALAETPTAAGIIVLPDVRGLVRYYEELALRFAEIGVDAIAIDYRDTVASFEGALESAAVPHRIVTYEGAPHSFFDRKHDAFADASAAAWAEVRTFVGSAG